MGVEKNETEEKLQRNKETETCGQVRAPPPHPPAEGTVGRPAPTPAYPVAPTQHSLHLQALPPVLHMYQLRGRS